mgnify:CR=1 FL=1
MSESNQEEQEVNTVTLEEQAAYVNIEAEAYAKKAEATANTIEKITPHLTDIFSGMRGGAKSIRKYTLFHAAFRYLLIYGVIFSFIGIAWFLIKGGDIANGMLLLSHVGVGIAGFISGFGVAKTSNNPG